MPSTKSIDTFMESTWYYLNLKPFVQIQPYRVTQLAFSFTMLVWSVCIATLGKCILSTVPRTQEIGESIDMAINCCHYT